MEKGTIKCEQGLLKVNNFLNGWGKTMLYRAYPKVIYVCMYSSLKEDFKKFVDLFVRLYRYVHVLGHVHGRNLGKHLVRYC